MFYKFSEDSKLLLDSLIKNSPKQKNKILICEMGVGSGEVIFRYSNYLKKNNVDFEVIGFDINKKAIENTKKLFCNFDKKNEFILSNLFEKSKKKYDLIFFNTPYLPVEDNENFEDLKIIDKAIYGGEFGFEITIKFLEELDKNLKKNGVCFILISTLTNPKVVEKKLKNLNFKYEVVNSKKLFFEILLVYKIQKV